MASSDDSSDNGAGLSTGTLAPPGVVAALRARLASAEAQAALFEEWFDVAFAHSPIATSVISAAENRYVRVNRAMADLVGRSREEILSVDPFSFSFKITHPDDLSADQQLFGELAVGARRSYQVEKRFLRPDGTYIWGLLCVSGAFEEQRAPGMPVGPLRFIAVHIIDISLQKAQAEALVRHERELRHAQRIDGIGRLAGGIAHDFNNLLTVIVGHGELLRDLVRDVSGRGDRHDRSAASAEGPKGRPEAGGTAAGGDTEALTRDFGANLEAILAAADRAGSLTAQLLAHGRREPVMPATFELSEAVAAMHRLLVRVIGSNIETDQDLEAIGAVRADKGQVGQVVMNLVLNARDAMPDGGHLTLATRDVAATGSSAGSDADGRDWVALVVGDTGHGMSPEVQARIFEPFFTTREDRPGTQGSGLGLATVQRIVAELGGRITLVSAPGQGSTFTVHFPRVASVPKSEAAQGAGRQLAPTGAERVLVVEDEPSVRALVGTVLAGAHYHVTVARNGEEALSFIAAAEASEQPFGPSAAVPRRPPFDLIVTDLVMARVGGAALAKRLHARGGAPRMLFISGYSDAAPVELLPYGDLLPKPFTPNQLLAAVRRALDEEPP